MGLRGGSEPEADARYLRRLLTQESEPRLVAKLFAELPAYARAYPEAPFSGEALYYVALLHAEQRNDAAALRYALRSAYLYPSGERTDDALRLLARIIERNGRWHIGYEEAASLARLPAARDSDARFVSAVRRLRRLDAPEIREAALDEARAFLEQYRGGPYMNEGLALTAGILRDLGRPSEAAEYLAAIVVSGPDSKGWAGNVLDLARLYRGPLGNRRRAEILLRAVIEGAPDSYEATTAADLLAQ